MLYEFRRYIPESLLSTLRCALILLKTTSFSFVGISATNAMCLVMLTLGICGFILRGKFGYSGGKKLSDVKAEKD